MVILVGLIFIAAVALLTWVVVFLFFGQWKDIGLWVLSVIKMTVAVLVGVSYPLAVSWPVVAYFAVLSVIWFFLGFAVRDKRMSTP